jgi:hypothetical protein
MRAALLETLPGGTYYAALSAGDPGDAAATLNEPTIGTNGYARRILQWDPSVPIPLSGAPAVLSCWYEFIWTATGPWFPDKPITHLAIFTTATGTSESEFIGSAAVYPPRLIDRAGIVLRMPAYSLTLSLGLED